MSPTDALIACHTYSVFSISFGTAQPWERTLPACYFSATGLLRETGARWKRALPELKRGSDIIIEAKSKDLAARVSALEMEAASNYDRA